MCKTFYYLTIIGHANLEFGIAGRKLGSFGYKFPQPSLGFLNHACGIRCWRNFTTLSNKWQHPIFIHDFQRFAQFDIHIFGLLKFLQSKCVTWFEWPQLINHCGSISTISLFDWSWSELCKFASEKKLRQDLKK